jgi:hypothetical protein
VSFQKFGDEIRRAASFTNVVNRKNVRMIQRGDSARFLLEPPQPVRIFRKGFRQNLIATSRPSLVSLARNTSPIPPAPIGATIS